MGLLLGRRLAIVGSLRFRNVQKLLGASRALLVVHDELFTEHEVEREDAQQQYARDHGRAPVTCPEPCREHHEADNGAQRRYGDRQFEGAMGARRAGVSGSRARC